jgi:hypothetical protein
MQRKVRKQITWLKTDMLIAEEKSRETRLKDKEVRINK